MKLRQVSENGFAVLLGELPVGERTSLRDIRLHEPIEVAALLGCGLTTRHLESSAKTLMKGSTAAIDHEAVAVFAWLGCITSIKPGTVIGFGTIPDRAGPDHDDVIDRGAEIEIRFERLGRLRCRFAEPAAKLLPSRWPLRPAPQRFHGR